MADGGLRLQIEQALGEAKGTPNSALEARRRANDAARNATALLRSEGYYEATIEPDVAPGGGFRPVLRIVPGPRFHFSPPVIEWIDTPPDPQAITFANLAIGLAPAAPGRSADVLAAEGRVIGRLQKLGYADAAIGPRQVVVDHADATVAATLRINAGRPARLGAVRALGKGRARPGWLRSLAPWRKGEPYNPALLALFEKRLLDTGVYEAATVGLAPAEAGEPAGERIVDVTLVDRRRLGLDVGASYSTTEGSGVDAKLTRYNRLGLGDSLILVAKLYDIQQKLDLEQDLPHWLRADQTLKVGGGFLGDRTSAYDDQGAGIRFDIIRRKAKISAITVGGAFDFASTREKVAVNLLAAPVGQDLKLLITTGKLAYNLDRSNALLDPTRGWRLDAEANPTWVAGDRNIVYLKTDLQLSGYLPMTAGGPVLAARAKLGSILGGAIPQTPADRRFYAGGGGSVRGFGYQAVGPRLSDNTPEGGLSLAEGTVELRQHLIGQWGVVAFADAGAVGVSQTPRFDNLSIGAGVGVRYDLGFGPLRLDLATPVNPRKGDSPIQVYISIGQAF